MNLSKLNFKTRKENKLNETKSYFLIKLFKKIFKIEKKIIN